MSNVEIETAKRYITYFGGDVKYKENQTILTDRSGKDIASVECDFEGFKDLDLHEEQCAFDKFITLSEIVDKD